MPIRSAANAEELNIALNVFADKRLVLIDTAGMSQQDVRISEQLGVLRAGRRRVQTLLTLSATTQQATMKQAIKAFGVSNPAAMILTKLDEAGSLGGVLSAIIGSGLKVSSPLLSVKSAPAQPLRRPRAKGFPKTCTWRVPIRWSVAQSGWRIKMALG